MMYSLCLTFSYFFFRQKRITKISLEQKMFMSGSNIREAADLKDVIATGKSSLVTRLVCRPLSVILAIGNE